jgi:hypothetical protein
LTPFERRSANIADFKGGDRIAAEAFANSWGGAPSIACADFV